MHSLPYSGRGRLSALTIPPASHALLFEATDYESPPSEKAIAKCALDYLSPRVVMSTHVFREEIVTELLLKGLKDNGENAPDEPVVLKLPERGCVPVDEVDEISESLCFFYCTIYLSIAKFEPSYPVHKRPTVLTPFQGPLHVLLSRPHSPGHPKQFKFTHPPTYLVTGTTDEMFSPDSHTIPYYDELLRQNVPAEVRLVPGAGHAFDVWAEIGSPIAEEVVRPAVGWVAGVIGWVC